MGKLMHNHQRKLRAGIGIVVAIVMLCLIGITIARAGPFEDTPLEVLEAASIVVQIAPNDEYSHVQALWGDRTIWLSSGVENHLQPHRAGRYVIWTTIYEGRGQIELYDLFTGSLVRLTQDGTHQKPRVNRAGQAVWETWADDVWQVAFFDGTTTKLLEPGEISINPDISEDDVVYATRKPGEEWISKKYQISSQEIQTIETGADAKIAQFDQQGGIEYPNQTPTAPNIAESLPDLTVVAGQLIDVVVGNPDPDESIEVGVFEEN